MARKIVNCCKRCNDFNNLEGQLSNWTVQDVEKIVRKVTKNYHGAVEKIQNYFYIVNYNDYDYEDGYKVMKNFKDPSLEKRNPFSCSAFSKYNFMGRNFDWTYSEYPTFLITTKAVKGRHATMGVSSVGFGDLTVQNIESGKELQGYSSLPFFMADIINDSHLYISINVVPTGDKGITTGTNPEEREICQLMVPRYLADFASSAKEAVEMLKTMNVYSPIGIINEEIHGIIRDLNNIYIVEWIDNELHILSNTDMDYDNIPNDLPIMTNFYEVGWNGEIKTVYSGYTSEEVESTGLTQHSCGLERYQLIKNKYESIENKDDIEDLLKDIRYSKLYDKTAEPYWYSEFAGVTSKFGDLTIYNKKEDFDGIRNYAIELYEKHQRDGSFWITSHSSIYDLDALKLYLFIEEQYDKKYEFSLDLPGRFNSMEFNNKFDERFTENVNEEKFKDYVIKGNSEDESLNIFVKKY